MAQRGRPLSEAPKNIQVKFLADITLDEDIEFCCSRTGLKKSELFRQLIEQKKSELLADENKTSTTKTVNAPINLIPDKKEIATIAKVLELIESIADDSSGK